MKNKLPPFIEIYRALIATPSISATEEALDQSNAGLITLLADWFKDLGFSVEVQPVPGTRNKFNMLASTGTGAGGLLLAAVDRGITIELTDFDEPGIVASSTAVEGEQKLSPGVDPQLPKGHWANYVQAVIDRLHLNFEA